MNKKTMITFAAASLLPLAGFAQTPPPPPPNAPGQPGQVPPPPPEPPQDKRPKVPVTFLGVETSEVPSVVSEQLGLAKGFGLVVDYVVKDGPAAAAGVQQNDILKMLNDQILTEPDQLAKLVRSFPEGTTVNLTILRKGAETKVSVKLAKREVPARHGMIPDFDKHWKFDHDFGQMNEEMNDEISDLTDELGDAKRGMIHDAVERARSEARRARDEARRAAQQIRVMSKEGGALKRTRIDLAKAQIVYSDAAGEMRVETVDGKKMLTAKDPQGRLLFSGPVETKEDLDKIPADVRSRYEKLEQKDFPSAVSPPEPAPATDDSAGDSMDQVSFRPTLPRSGLIGVALL